jgi:hypothetical protein
MNPINTRDEISISLSNQAQRAFLDSIEKEFPRNEGVARGGKSHRTGHLLIHNDDHNNRPVPEPRTPFQKGEAQ